MFRRLLRQQVSQPASQDEDSDDMDFSAPRKSRPSAPQLQAQLSRLTDRIRLGRLKDTLFSKGAWQQVTRIEDLCHAQVSHKWLYHLDACAGSVLTLHNCIANVQKRLGNRAWVGGGQCRCCGSFLDPQLEHAETCSNAEATRGHNACVHAVVCGLKLADLGITSEPRGLTASQSRPADIFTTAAVPGRSAASDVCIASSIAAAAREDAAQAAFDRKLSQRQQGLQSLSCGQRTDDRTRSQSPLVGMGSRCGRNHSIAGGSMKSKSLSSDGGQPWLALSCRILQREQSGSSLAY